MLECECQSNKVSSTTTVINNLSVLIFIIIKNLLLQVFVTNSVKLYMADNFITTMCRE